MTSEQKAAYRDRLITALIAAVVTSLVPILFALLSGLVNAPARLTTLEGASRQQTQELQKLNTSIDLLVLLRCLQQERGNGEIYSRLGCQTITDRAPAVPGPRRE